MKKLASLAIQNALSEDSSVYTKAQAGLNLRWAHMLAGTFSDVAAHICMLDILRDCSNRLDSSVVNLINYDIKVTVYAHRRRQS